MILKALSLDPAGRFQSAEEFQETLTRVATRHRLLVGASEMSAHLKSIAGEDAAMWLRLEAMRPHGDRGEPTQTHGTAVLSTQGIVDGEDERRAEFDLSDAEEEEDEDSDVADLLRARNRPPSLPTGELTSVIAVRKKQGRGASDLLNRGREDEPPLPALQPRRSEPIAAPAASSSAPRRVAQTPCPVFGNDESRQADGGARGRLAAPQAGGVGRWPAGGGAARGRCDQAASAVASRLRALARSCRRDVEPARRLAAVRQLAAVRSDGICGHGGRGAPLADVGDPAQAARPAVRRRGLRRAARAASSAS